MIDAHKAGTYFKKRDTIKVLTRKISQRRTKDFKKLWKFINKKLKKG